MFARKMKVTVPIINIQFDYFLLDRYSSMIKDLMKIKDLNEVQTLKFCDFHEFMWYMQVPDRCQGKCKLNCNSKME